MVDLNAALCHHFFEIAQTQGISEVPTNTLGNDIDRIMQTFERFSDKGHRSGLAQKQGSLPDDRLMRQNRKKTPAGLIALSVAELRKLLTKLMGKMGETIKQILHWSSWRRRHQYYAQQGHYRRRDNLMITEQLRL
ncbi:hypothetical protein XBKQ1_1380002 [Xenorhabdus bovienii str. kraussei Quebec]|uniref:Uncharacterized protein n=2 Tax=Xenorhabdus bovienii TaxID=40576 RepID=A0A077PFY5_XENBV|nr:hypothetical protein XBKQ1_1380002 [Xenorhabdus bovienii str. kraussei Quebec]